MGAGGRRGKQEREGEARVGGRREGEEGPRRGMAERREGGRERNVQKGGWQGGGR